MTKPRYISNAINAVRRIANDLENACPADTADSKTEDIAHELIHALRDAAGIAERSET